MLPASHRRPSHEVQSLESLMRRALALAVRGRGLVEPNPMVGCVIVRGGEVIAEGHHARFGGPHAEAAALLACGGRAEGATAVVTLEPCCHLNKKTPPCAPALLHAGVTRVVVGTPDPNPQVSGGGVAQLRAAGVEVIEGVLEPECQQLIAPWYCMARLGRPYVTLKWAQSADGLVAGSGGRRVQISGDAATRAVHELRARCDAIMVGIGTVLADDPMLTARGVAEARPLLRIVLDRHLRLPLESRLVKSAGEGRVRVYCGEEAAESPRAAELRARGVAVEAVRSGAEGVDVAAVLASLGREQLTHLLVEPGPTLAASLLAKGRADRAWVIQCDRSVREDGAPTAKTIEWPVMATCALGADQLREHLNPQGEAYFAPAASPDFSACLRAPQMRVHPPLATRPGDSSP
jgi:diaminohydroxyphosphoribosylaminopyrimidine deaminase/5-amino-6-(5-phosphoribosylamino)uracil reductase